MEEIIKLLREKEEREGEKLSITTYANGCIDVLYSDYNKDIEFDNDQELIEWLKK